MANYPLLAVTVCQLVVGMFAFMPRYSLRLQMVERCCDFEHGYMFINLKARGYDIVLAAADSDRTAGYNLGPGSSVGSIINQC